MADASNTTAMKSGGYYSARTDEIRTAPQDHAMDYVHAYMTIAKGGPR